MYLYFNTSEVMKELIAKIKQHNANIVKHYEADDKEAVLKELEELEPVIEEAEKEADKEEVETTEDSSEEKAENETAENEETAPDEEKAEETTEEKVEKCLAEVKKFADLYVSNDSLQWLLKELTESIKIISWKVEKLEEKVDAVAEAEGESQQQEESVEKTEKDSFQWW